MRDRFGHVRELFLAALERDGLAAQLEYVSTHCAELSDLRAEVENMLRAHHDSSGFLRSQARKQPGHSRSLKKG